MKIFRTRIVNAVGNRIIKVNGYNVNSADIPEFDCFVHKKTYKDGVKWFVVEKKSGLCIGISFLKRLAIDNAKEKIKELSVEKINDIINSTIEKFGILQ